MDPRTRIDYALFHLTPTRTRCDLIIYANGQCEKLASGLLEPFLLHLKCAKEQILRGGYSITLTPPPPAAWFTKGTLQRFVRFVSTPEVLERFVTLEKEIERIEEFICSNELECEEVDADGKGAAADDIHKGTISSSKSIDEVNGTNNAAQEEHSNVRFQRVLETRKVVLHKEQAMAYARALATGFEMNHLDALVAFADTFGASRLREACYNFMELRKSKNQDRLWLAEVAAMQASSQLQLSYSGTSGILLADDVKNSSPNQGSPQLEINGNAQTPLSWTNHHPQYFPGYYGPIHPQNMPPYHGYHFPGVQVGGPYFPGKMNWPTYMEDPSLERGNKSSGGKKKRLARNKANSSREIELDVTEHDMITEHSDSGSESATDNVECEKRHSSKKNAPKKENGKKLSKKVVIGNINYVTSKKDGAKSSVSEEKPSEDEELFDGDSIKQQIEEAVSSLNRRQRHKKRQGRKRVSAADESNELNPGSSATKISVREINESWGAFQDILMRDHDTNSNALHPVQVENDTFVAKSYEGRELSKFNQEAEGVTRQRVLVSTDSFVAYGRDMGLSNGDKIHIQNFNKDNKNIRHLIKNSDGMDEMMVISTGAQEQGNLWITPSDFASHSSIVKCKTGEDWYINTQNNGSSLQDGSDLNVLEGEYKLSVANSSAQTDKHMNQFFDDSITIQARTNHYESEMNSDLSMVLDIAQMTHRGNGSSEKPQDKLETSGNFEPDDLYIVLDRNFILDPVMASWSPVIDFENDIRGSETDNNNQKLSVENDGHDQIAENKLKGATEGKVPGKEARSKSLRGSPGSRKQLPGNKTLVRKTKQELDEEQKRRTEELLIQRQKRIAERKSGSVMKFTSNQKETMESMKNIKNEMLPVRALVKEKNPVVRTSIIGRLATARESNGVSGTQLISSPSKKAGSKAVNVTKKTPVVQSQKPAPSKAQASDKKHNGVIPNGQNGSDSIVSVKEIPVELSKAQASDKKYNGVIPNGQNGSDPIAAIKEIPVELSTLQPLEDIFSPELSLSIVKNSNEIIPTGRSLDSDKLDKEPLATAIALSIEVASVPSLNTAIPNFEDVKDLQTLAPSEAKEKIVSHVDSDDRKSFAHDTPEAVEQTTSQHSDEKTPDQGVSEQPLVASAEKSTDFHPEVHPNTKTISNPDAVPSNMKPAKAPTVTFAPTPKISETWDNSQASHSRKKWDNSDNATKVAKGLKKLLLFGRKSRLISYA